jgi:shikimate kinase
MKIKDHEKSNIALIGFMCAGKTSVGKMLAEKLGREFVDTDDVIVEIADLSVEDIFEKKGEISFREIEIDAVKKTAASKNAVISCGGGVVYNKINIDRLKASSHVVFLKVSPESVIARAEKDDHERPLLKGKDRIGIIKKLLALRDPLYTAYSDFSIDTTDASIEEVTKKIIERIGE